MDYLVQLLLPDGTWMTTSCPPEKISEQRRDCPDDTYRIVKLVVVDGMSEWIDVNDRLPEDGVEVLVCLGALVNLDDGFASRYVGWLDYDDQPPSWIIAGEHTEGVTHWRALPSPPRFEEVVCGM